jgi:hypothetical protein
VSQPSLSIVLHQRTSICLRSKPPRHLCPHETLLIACPLALTSGYLKAYTWIVHRVPPMHRPPSAGAAIGAIVTEATRAYSPCAIPVILLAIVLVGCEKGRSYIGH